MSKKFLITFVLTIIFCLLISGAFVVGYHFGYNNYLLKNYSVSGSSDLELINEALGQIKDNYYAKTNKEKLIQGALEGITKSLNNPFAEYLSPKNYKSFNQHMAGNYSGVGMILGFDKEQVYVVSLFEGSPAEASGIKEGDYIVKVDNRTVKEIGINTVAEHIKGPEGTKVKLLLKRKGKEIPFELTRRKIELPNVSSKMIGKIGYVKVHQFTRDLSEQVKKKMSLVLSKKPKGLILDLRGNPGGELDQAIDLVGLYVNNVVVVRTKSKQGEEKSYSSGQTAIYKGKLVVLVDKGSASASEIVAGALQDHKRATIIGEQTFGKGCVQNVITLSNKGALIIPSQKWFTPSWRSIDKKGITPDIVVKYRKNGDTDNQLQKALSILN
ncbi:MAG: S41 family peptidase [Actinobacteria bacterium]|nr:MAG: S41 family peptidase [Actinomycetota bacterium]